MEGPEVQYPHNVIPASITGIPDHPVKNVLLENTEIMYEGGAAKTVVHFSYDSMTKVPENISHYPEFSMFGELPYWDFYVRHAEKKYQLTQKKDDFR